MQFMKLETLNLIFIKKNSKEKKKKKYNIKNI